MGPQTNEKNRLERLLDIATIVAAQGETPSPPASQREWVASFPEAELLRLTCRAAYGDRVLLAHVARMRLGKTPSPGTSTRRPALRWRSLTRGS